MITLELKNYLTTEKKILTAIVRRLREVDFFRPDQLENEWKLIFEIIASDPLLLRKYQSEIYTLLGSQGFDDILCESNISSHGSFWQEFFSKIRHKILPKLRSENPFRFKLRRIIDFDKDKNWLSKLSDIQIEEACLLFFKENKLPEETTESMLHSMRVISHHIASIGINNRMNIRGRKGSEHHADFFAVSELTFAFQQSLKISDKDCQSCCDQLLQQIDRCRKYLNDLALSAVEQGTDIQRTFMIQKCNDLLNRLHHITVCLSGGIHNSVQSRSILVKDIFEEEYSSQDFSDFIKTNLKTLSLRISDHASKTGEHYIAANFREYSGFLWAALGAGFVVSILVFFKAWLHQAELPLFWEAMAYSINYAFGFLLIQIFHFTLATKQPAMTASAIAKSLDVNKDGKVDLNEMAITIARVFHTQTISFIGNLLVTFPLPFVLAFLMDYFMDYQLYGAPEALKVMDNQHPWRSLALMYAAITGVFLFISGLIAGYVDNRVIFSRIPERVRQSKSLHRFLGFKTTNKFARYLNHSAGGLAGNISLGFFLGTATFFGSITGLPFDIRHITFAAGTFSSALYCAGDLAVLSDVIITIIGILLIGFVNFSVSFGLAFYLACKSRDISIRKTPELLSVLWRYFRRYPMDFFRAPQKPRKAEDLASLH